MFEITATFHLEKKSSWLKKLYSDFCLMLLMGVLIADTYTFSKINSYEIAHISKIFSECFVYNTSCLFYKTVTSSLIV